MNQADVSKLISQLRIVIGPRHRNLKTPRGPEGRMLKLRQTVSGLIKFERLELFEQRADEARGYAERLISDAIRYGPNDKNMMEMADYWMLDKANVHKLFKVLVPRFQDYTTSYTDMVRAPQIYPKPTFKKLVWKRSILELKGNPFPPLKPNNNYRNRNLIHNVLLDSARKDFDRERQLIEAAFQKKPVELQNEDTIEIEEKK